jgi:glucokinase
MSILAIDFGGTRTRTGWFDAELNLLHRTETPSLVKQSAQQVIDRIIQTAREVVPTNHIPTVIGIAAPGPLDPQRGVIHHALTLPGWKEVPLATLISQAFGGAPTHIQNDANLAALAEYHFGAGKGCDPLLYLTLSTGIGGGAVIGGKLFAGWNGLAIEPGHQRFTLPSGQTVRLEEVASGTAIGSWARERLSQSAEDSLLRHAPVVDGQAVGRAAQAGDPFALHIIQETGQWLGLGLVNLLHLFNPQAIVVGGSVSTLGDLVLEPARQVIREHILHPDFWRDEVLRLAALGDDVCLFGAASYARECLLG